VARLGSVINNELSPAVASAFNVSTALWVGVVMCIVSFIAVLLLLPIDKRAELADARFKARSGQTDAAQSVKFSDFRKFRPAFWLLALSCLVVYGCVIPFNNVASSLLMERDFFRLPPSECVRCGVGAYANETTCPTLAPACPPVPPYAWPLPKLSANCTIKEPSDQADCSHTPPFIDESKINCDDYAWKIGPFTDTYCKKKSEAAERAATPMSIPYIISAVISPFLGFIVDRIGMRAFLALLAPLALTSVHVMLGLTQVNLYVPLVLQGVAYSVFAAALWPSVPCRCHGLIHYWTSRHWVLMNLLNGLCRCRGRRVCRQRVRCHHVHPGTLCTDPIQRRLIWNSHAVVLLYRTLGSHCSRSRSRLSTRATSDTSRASRCSLCRLASWAASSGSCSTSLITRTARC
jgi:hypothetical protein